jgi:hypothetical protein
MEVCHPFFKPISSKTRYFYQDQDSCVEVERNPMLFSIKIRLLSSQLTGKFTHLLKDTIITSFPKRYGRNKPDPSAVHKSIRIRLKNARKNEIRSVYDLALIIIDECAKVFFDRTKTADRQPQVMDIFAEAIGNIVSLALTMIKLTFQFTDGRQTGRQLHTLTSGKRLRHLIQVMTLKRKPSRSSTLIQRVLYLEKSKTFSTNYTS